ncbi:MAG: UDP-N-acetylglucosamine 2-epimerase [Thermosipho sp. (in: Bacteria)]|nr:UDP-N-acetylglucosamine 2-epimerase [Thermosipho sp. (in: thermotogales)]
MKIISLIGARPQFIKEAIVNKELKEKENIKEIIVHSGQHYDFNMSDVFFKVLNIQKPDYFLNVGSGLHGEMTGKIMIEFEKVVLKEKPVIILVYGETNTTLAGAVVGAKLKIPVAHIEPGIRQEPKDMPEEINRTLTDHVSTFLFCPSKLSVKNLEKEGITKGVYFVGEVMYDLYLEMEDKFKYDIFRELKLKENEYIVMTLHRDFNANKKERVKEYNFEKYLEKVKVIEPIDYLNLTELIKKSWKILTDSGGLQKEAYFAKKRAIVVMPDTGWRKLIEVG